MGVPLPDLGENYRDYRADQAAFSASLHDVAFVFLTLGRAELKRAKQERRAPTCKGHGIATATRNLIQAPAEWKSREGYKYGVRWLSPGYYAALKQGSLANTRVTRDHPFVRYKTRDLVFELIFNGAKQSESALLHDIEKLLDSRLDVVCHLEDEKKSKGGWILTEKSGDGWERYAKCPRRGLWDRQERVWSHPWL